MSNAESCGEENGFLGETLNAPQLCLLANSFAYVHPLSNLYFFDANTLILGFCSDRDDEFVVPHMEIDCALNSNAYLRVLEDPFTYLENWDALNVKAQAAAAEAFFGEAQDIRSRSNSGEVIWVMPAIPNIVDSTPKSCASFQESAKSD